MTNKLCSKPHGKYKHLCTKPHGHKGACSRNSISSVLNDKYKHIARKIRTDAYITPGDAKSVKNRADRCYPVKLSQEEVASLNKRGDRAVGIRKKFSSTQQDCFEIHKQLTAQALCIPGVLEKVSSPKNLSTLNFLGPLIEGYRDNPNNSLSCRICGEPILEGDFITEHGSALATSAQIGHIFPPNGKDSTAHRAGNVQWIHRDCNLIQGDKTEEETLDKLKGIIENLKNNIQKSKENAE